jgi:hypothetical protein
MHPVLHQLGRVSHLQCAASGLWEQALRFDASDALPSEDAIRAWLGPASDFALEFFFVDDEGLPQFVGVRWHDLSVLHIAATIRQAHQLLQTAHGDRNVTAVILALEQRLELPLLRGPVAFLEVGVNNLWKSTGSLVIWRPGQLLPSSHQLRQNISEHASQLLQRHPNPVMLEVAYTSPQPHWLGLCVSRRVGLWYALDIEALYQFAQSVLGTSSLGIERTP